MNSDAVDVAKASYSRCQDAPEFLLEFYQEFFRACPLAQPLFANTDLERQAKLLRHAIGLLLAFPNQSAEGRSMLARLAAKHGPQQLDVDPTWYPLFQESLIRTASRHDPAFTPEIAQAWQEALAPGIAYMQRYR